MDFNIRLIEVNMEPETDARPINEVPIKARLAPNDGVIIQVGFDVDGKARFWWDTEFPMFAVIDGLLKHAVITKMNTHTTPYNF